MPPALFPSVCAIPGQSAPASPCRPRSTRDKPSVRPHSASRSPSSCNPQCFRRRHPHQSLQKSVCAAPRRLPHPRRPSAVPPVLPLLNRASFPRAAAPPDTHCRTPPLFHIPEYIFRLPLSPVRYIYIPPVQILSRFPQDIPLRPHPENARKRLPSPRPFAAFPSLPPVWSNPRPQPYPQRFCPPANPNLRKIAPFPPHWVPTRHKSDCPAACPFCHQSCPAFSPSVPHSLPPSYIHRPLCRHFPENRIYRKCRRHAALFLPKGKIRHRRHPVIRKQGILNPPFQLRNHIRYILPV